MSANPQEDRTVAATERDVALCADSQHRETTTYTYDADRLAAIMQREQARVTTYRYDACAERLDDTSAPAPATVETPDAKGD